MKYKWTCGRVGWQSLINIVCMITLYVCNVCGLLCADAIMYKLRISYLNVCMYTVSIGNWRIIFLHTSSSLWNSDTKTCWSSSTALGLRAGLKWKQTVIKSMTSSGAFWNTVQYMKRSLTFYRILLKLNNQYFNLAIFKKVFTENTCIHTYIHTTLTFLHKLELKISMAWLRTSVFNIHTYIRTYKKYTEWIVN